MAAAFGVASSAQMEQDLMHEPRRTHALRGAVKVFLILFKIHSPDYAGVVRYGV
jgi:hypothetical protein